MTAEDPCPCSRARSARRRHRCSVVCTSNKLETLPKSGHSPTRQPRIAVRSSFTRGPHRARTHDLAGFTRNGSALEVNQAGINASTTCSHEYPPAKRRLAKDNKEENTSRVIAWQRCPKVFSPLANANCSDVEATVGVRWRSDCARQLNRRWRLTASSLRT